MGLPVEKILKEKEIQYRLLKLTQSAFTVDDIKKYSVGEVNADEICKTIILKGKKTEKKVAILLRGNDKVHFSTAKKLFAEEMTVATPEEVKEASGVEPGAVCPFLLYIPLFVDTHVCKLMRINCGSGDHLYGLEFATKDLEKGVSYDVIDVVK